MTSAYTRSHILTPETVTTYGNTTPLALNATIGQYLSREEAADDLTLVIL